MFERCILSDFSSLDKSVVLNETVVLARSKFRELEEDTSGTHGNG